MSIEITLTVGAVLYFLTGFGIALAYDESLQNEVCTWLIFGWIVIIPCYFFVKIVKIVSRFLMRVLKIK